MNLSDQMQTLSLAHESAPIAMRMKLRRYAITVAWSLFAFIAVVHHCAWAQDVSFEVDVSRPVHRITPWFTGACIEDVNHEIYGGIYSQLIFGESFQEPSIQRPPKGFQAFGNAWTLVDDYVKGPAGNGNKLISDASPFSTGNIEVQLRFQGPAAGLAGLIFKVDQPAVGADNWIGYEVSLDPGRQVLLVGRHRNNWEHIQDIPCKVLWDEWNALRVQTTERTIDVSVNGQSLFHFEDNDHPLLHGKVGLRTWQRDADFKSLKIEHDGEEQSLRFEEAPAQWSDGVSGMWKGYRNGSAIGNYAVETRAPYHGKQSQTITFTSGVGSIGISNQGLKGWGIHLKKEMTYEGYLWVRGKANTPFSVSLEDLKGGAPLDEKTLTLRDGGWQRLDFQLKPKTEEPKGQFCIKLKQAGSLDVGHVFLQPSSQGRFANLPVRKDVAEGLIANGIKVLRMGGLMANAPEYRWKQAMGARDRRPPYRGYWYPYSTNGWGFKEFLDFCEAAKMLAIPDFNMDETPEDMADFVEYANGSAESTWGAKRVADGHEAPYQLKFLELGNEEAVDENYWTRFKPLAEAIWAKDANITLIVGDFEFKQPIVDPYRFGGAARIQSLAAHQKILDLAASHQRSVWFDVHIWNHDLHDADAHIAALPSLIDALHKLSPMADFRICVLEENSVNHAIRRGLAHARTIHGLMRLGDKVPVVCAANCLQPDGQNDDGWDQGLLFLNPTKAWPQPPLLVSRMIADHWQPNFMPVKQNGRLEAVDAVALMSEDGKKLTWQFANIANEPLRVSLKSVGGKARWRSTSMEEVSGDLNDVNTSDEPQRVVTNNVLASQTVVLGAEPSTILLKERSFTVICFEADSR